MRLVVALMMLFLILDMAGCSHSASNLARRQREVQNCILNGGVPQAGPDDSIICQH